MAKNMFINTTGLDIEKSMPALIGMDFSGIVQSKSNIDIGKAVSNFADKYKKIEQTNNTIKIQNQLNEMENKWQLQNMSDPNALMTADGRKSIEESYNNLIEQKKKLLIDAKGQFDSDTYLKLEGYFKNQTYDSLYKLQYKTNTAYIKETTDDVLLSTKLLVDTIALSDNEEERNILAQNGLKNIQGLEELGIDTREMCLNFITTTQQKSLEYEVEKNIMNNNTNEAFFMKDENGNFVYDSQGNNIIDNAKKMKALNNLYDGFLSDAAIMDAAKSISESTNIKVDDAFNVIKNIRQANIKIHRQYNESILNGRQQQSMYDAQKYQNQIKQSGQDEMLRTANYVSQGENFKALSGVLGMPITPQNINTPNIINLATDGRYNNLDEIASKGYQYFPMLTQDQRNYIKNSDIKSQEEYDALIGYIENTFKDTNPDTQTHIFAEIQKLTNIPASLFNIAINGSDAEKQQVRNVIIAQKSNPNIDSSIYTMPHISNFALFKSGAENQRWNEFVYKDLYTNSELWFDEVPSSNYKENSKDLVAEFYRAVNKSANRTKAIDRLNYLQKVYKWSNLQQFQIDINPTSNLMQTANYNGQLNKAIDTQPSLYKKDAQAAPDIQKNIVHSEGDIGNVSSGYDDLLISQLNENIKDKDKIQGKPLKHITSQDLKYNTTKSKVIEWVLLQLKNGTITEEDIPEIFYEETEIDNYFKILTEEE